MTRTAQALIALVVLVFLALNVATGTGAADEPQVVRVALSDYQLQLSQFTVTPGKPVQFIVTNSGVLPHQLVVEPYVSAGAAAGEDIPMIAPGTTRSFMRTLEAGVYRVECVAWDHAARGMVNALAADLPHTRPLQMQMNILIPLAALVLGAAYIIGDSMGLKLVASKHE